MEASPALVDRVRAASSVHVLGAGLNEERTAQILRKWALEDAA